MISDRDLADLAHELRVNPGHVVPVGTIRAIAENLLQQRQKARSLEKALTEATQYDMFPKTEVPVKRRARR